MADGNKYYCGDHRIRVQCDVVTVTDKRRGRDLIDST